MNCSIHISIYENVQFKTSHMLIHQHPGWNKLLPHLTSPWCAPFWETKPKPSHLPKSDHYFELNSSIPCWISSRNSGHSWLVLKCKYLCCLPMKQDTGFSVKVCKYNSSFDESILQCLLNHEWVLNFVKGFFSIYEKNHKLY